MSSSTDSLTGFYGWTNTLKGVYYGPGSLKTALPKLLEKTGITKAMVITGRSLYTKSDVVKQVENVLKDHNAYTITFYEIGQHSPIGEIRRAIDLFKQHNCDEIVSVGGGSPVDASKAILYNIQKDTGGPTLHQIAIPTTLSAAEYSIGAGSTDDSGHKVAVSSQDLAPAGIVLDAELTLATPGRLWLSTGIRALDHAVENLYREVLPYPMRVLCYTAIADLFENLKLSKADPSNVAVRQKLQIASWMSLWPIKLEQYAPLGLSHSLGHKLGARYSIPHGITSCLTLAPTVALMASINTQENKENLAKALFYLQQPSTGNVDGDVKHLASLIDGLVKDLGLHSTLSEYKVPEADLSEIADKAIGSQSLRGEMLNAQVTELLRSIY